MGVSIPSAPTAPEHLSGAADRPDLPPGHTAHLPGRGSLFYREVAGPPGAPVLFLLHGLGANADLNWHPAFEPLGRHFRVIAPDHRGHGRGIRANEPFSLADCADDVAALADALGIERFGAVGYSMGGPIAQLAWQRHPERVHGLVLCATARDFRGHPRERLLYGGLGMLSGLPHLTALRAGIHGAEWLVSRLFGGHPHADWAVEELRRSDLATVLQAALEVGSFSSREWTHEIDVPTVVVVTRRDRLVPPHRQHKLAQSLPGAIVFEVDGDHHVVSGDAEDFVHALVGACRAVSPWPPAEEELRARRGRRRRFGARRRRVALLPAAAAESAGTG